MHHPVVHISGRRLVDRNDFHGEFAEAFGFPYFYGRNINAWHDCMFSLESPSDGMTKVHAPTGGTVAIRLNEYALLKARRSDFIKDIQNAAAFVNWAKLQQGEQAVLTVAIATDDAPPVRAPRPQQGERPEAQQLAYDPTRLVLPQPCVEIEGDWLAKSSQPVKDLAFVLGLPAPDGADWSWVRSVLHECAVNGRMPDVPDGPLSATFVLLVRRCRVLEKRRDQFWTETLELVSRVNMDLIASGRPAAFAWAFYE